jgi:hypothetical protein
MLSNIIFFQDHGLYSGDCLAASVCMVVVGFFFFIICEYILGKILSKVNFCDVEGEMFMSILWYYRLEHTGTDPLPRYIDCEVFASRHRDVIPVACIEDRCYVLTLGEFNRFVIADVQGFVHMNFLEIVWLLHNFT